jgi:hypothetical protein
VYAGIAGKSAIHVFDIRNHSSPVKILYDQNMGGPGRGVVSDKLNFWVFIDASAHAELIPCLMVALVAVCGIS